MALQKLNHPKINIIVPSTQNGVVFRPFLVQEEKLLLMAKEENTLEATVKALKEIIEVCQEPKGQIDMSTLTAADLEWIFLKLRQYSVSNIIEQGYEDGEDEKAYNIRVDLNLVEPPVFPSKTF